MINYDELRAGFETAYVDGSVASSLAYRPQFISNNHREGKKENASADWRYDRLFFSNEFDNALGLHAYRGVERRGDGLGF